MGNSIRRFNICSDEKDIENKRNAAEKVIEISNSNRSDEKSLEESDPIESSSVKSVLFVTAGESNIVATSFEPEAPKDVTWRRCSVQLNAMNESKLSDPIEIEMNTDDPLVISLLPHQHTLFCERKQRVCTAVGKLQELEYLTVSTSNDDPLSNYSFRWIRYKSAELDSHYESISESENCDTYQLQREDVGFWIGILYIDLRENVGKFSTVSDSVLKECLSEKEDDKPEYSPDSKDDETKVGHEDIYRMEVTIDLESSAKENSELSIPHVVDSTPSSETTLTTPLEAEGHLEATETLAPTEIIAPSDNPSATGNEVQSIPLPETAEAQQASAAWKPILRRVGPVLAGPPRLLDMTVHLLSLNGEASGQSEPVQVAAARSQYIGGQEGCSEFWWFRISPDGRRVQLTEPTPTPAPSPDRQDDQQMDDAPSFEIVEKDPRYYRITKEDIGCTLKVKCRPVRSDDFKGEIFTSKSSSIITSFERKEDSNS